MALKYRQRYLAMANHTNGNETLQDDCAITEAKKELEKWKALIVKEEDKKSRLVLEKLDGDDSKTNAQNQLTTIINEGEKLKQEFTTRMKKLEEDFCRLEKGKEILRERLKSNLAEVEASKLERQKLQQRFKVYAAISDSKVVFARKVTEEEEEGESRTDIKGVFTITQKPAVILSGGQALITFEEEKVASQILKMAKCLVSCEKDKLDVKPRSLKLDSTVKFEIHLDVSRKSIRFSDVPPTMEEERMRDRLEMSFSRPSRGGGEVGSVEYDKRTGAGLITFLNTGVAENLAMNGTFPADLDSRTTVAVQPVYDYQLKKFQTFCGTLKRTILLDDVKDVEDEEDLQDHLEIHFQKPSNYGGEVESIKYLSAGKKVCAFFTEDTTAQTEEA